MEKELIDLLKVLKNLLKIKMFNSKNKTFIIAELSANHNNDFNIAVKTIEAIAKSGADAVKVQTYKASSLTLDADNEIFGPKKDGLWKGQKPWDILSVGSMPYEWQPKLKKVAEDLGLIFFSTPFDFESVDFLESFENPIYKVASLEVNDIPLIKYIAEKQKPMIISTGVASFSDIEKVIEVCNSVGNNKISLLKCTSEYPAPVERANLLTIPDMIKSFGVPVGISDHTLGITLPIVAVTLGATIVEKHFIFDRNFGGPDSAFSIEPADFKQMVNSIREAELSLGNVDYELSEKDKLRRRSIFVIKDISKGEFFNSENIRSIRPGFGISPKYYYDILGKTATRNIIKGTPLNWDLISD